MGPAPGAPEHILQQIRGFELEMSAMEASLESLRGALHAAEPRARSLAESAVALQGVHAKAAPPPAPPRRPSQRLRQRMADCIAMVEDIALSDARAHVSTITGRGASCPA